MVQNTLPFPPRPPLLLFPSPLHLFFGLCACLALHDSLSLPLFSTYTIVGIIFGETSDAVGRAMHYHVVFDTYDKPVWASMMGDIYLR